jgi:hypothetical protein
MPPLLTLIWSSSMRDAYLILERRISLFLCLPLSSLDKLAIQKEIGRYGSSRVRFPIHAPLKPSATNTRGPRQHVEARMAAKPPTKSSPNPVRSREFSTA